MGVEPASLTLLCHGAPLEPQERHLCSWQRLNVEVLGGTHVGLFENRVPSISSILLEYHYIVIFRSNSNCLGHTPFRTHRSKLTYHWAHKIRNHFEISQKWNAVTHSLLFFLGGCSFSPMPICCLPACHLTCWVTVSLGFPRSGPWVLRKVKGWARSSKRRHAHSSWCPMCSHLRTALELGWGCTRSILIGWEGKLQAHRGVVVCWRFELQQ